jgi:hypothetical protein
MSSDADRGGDDFDVVLFHGATSDVDGSQVRRARPGRVETGEVRPLRAGKPIVPGAQVVQLTPRPKAPGVFDVRVDYEAPRESGVSERPAANGGPAQVATHAYRESWERTFGAEHRPEMLN